MTHPAHSAQPERTHAKASAQSRIKRMPKNAEDLLMYRHFMEERDEILAEMPNPPEPDNNHLDIAILEAWADGLIDDTYLDKEFAKCHKEVRECLHCFGECGVLQISTASTVHRNRLEIGKRRGPTAQMLGLCFDRTGHQLDVGSNPHHT